MKPETHRSSTRRSITSRRINEDLQHRTEVSAGGLVFKRTSKGVYFAMLKDPFGKWTFPKGHVKKARGESYRKAGEREVREELGLVDLKFIRPLGKIDIWFRDQFVFKGKMVHKFIYYFLFEVPDGTDLPKIKGKAKEEFIQAAAWVAIDKVASRSGYADMDPVVRRALGYFRKIATRD
ncbi:MAG: NUDIX domain-containing protein [Candidatus Uhrbacteria bacterium]|nr:NUDIX domain-containing protein [Candidatus Uhrbacteria bacterium]